jgi:hypothetical protein
MGAGSADKPSVAGQKKCQRSRQESVADHVQHRFIS